MTELLQLTDIQKMQFHDKSRAEDSLLAFLKRTEDSSIADVELRPRPESLNSINGFVTYANGERYFFKAHIEENEKISEYYNASLLAEAGYPVITAKRIKQRPGQQIAFYEVLTLPTLFDLAKEEEDDLIANKQLSNRAILLIRAQADLDKRVFQIYEATLQAQDREKQDAAPINQMFSHRLSDDGRVGLFYRNQNLQIGNDSVPFERLASLRWQINGVEYSSTLEQVIQRSKKLLAPRQGPAVVGHGDAHNGNIFVTHQSGIQTKQIADGTNSKNDPGANGTGQSSSTAPGLVMFDPAFAGSHHPLLDLTKPLFHNIFARWMYFPEVVEREFHLSFDLKDDRIIIEHDFTISALRRQFLESKLNNLLRPTLKLLQSRQFLQEDWDDYLRSALFCCPFLTVNLFAQPVAGGTLAEKYSLSIKLLALATAMEFGSVKQKGSNPISEIIDEIFAGSTKKV